MFHKLNKNIYTTESSNLINKVENLDSNTIYEKNESFSNFKQVISNPNYITHYIAVHRHFCSKVIVVLWRSILPGPSLIHDNLPLLYMLLRSLSEFI
jgi:hypothetical protein